MLDRLTRRSRRPSGRDLQLLFAATIVLPGVLLAVVGMRAWLQERALADQQLRERVGHAADLALRDFEQDLRSWQAVLDRFVGDGPPPLAALDGSMRGAFATPGAGAVVVHGSDALVTWPERQMPYLLTSPVVLPTSRPVSPLLDAAELVELRDQNPVRAIALYRDALQKIPAGARAPALVGLARALRKAGREAEAIAIYRELAVSTERVGTLPADLVGRHEICALAASRQTARISDCQPLGLYRDLVDGRWRLGKTRYLFYSASLRGMLAPSAARTAAAPWIAIEDRKMALAAAAAVLDGSASASDMEAVGPVVVVRSRATPGVALLLSRTWLASSHWPETFTKAVSGGFHLTVQDPRGDTWYDSSPGHHGAATPVARQPETAGANWRLRVSPLDAASLMADVGRWRTITLVMLLLLVALLGFGTYLTTRVVRREVEVARLQSDFVAAVSHEFRSPLTGIRQLAEMLRRGRVPDDSRRQEYYVRLTRESDRLSRLVENLLDLAQIEEGRKEYRYAPIDTTAWLRSVVEEAGAHPSLQHTRIEAAIPDALPPLRGDRAALSSALHNLLDNAVKYSPGTGVVWCDAEAQGDGVVVRVRDRGVGISDDDRRHVFDRFHRGHHPITQQVKGTGLGLSLVAHIVQAHGGRVCCDSRIGEGSTFSIHLAASPAGAGA